jgi:hypothetical protein
MTLFADRPSADNSGSFGDEIAVVKKGLLAKVLLDEIRDRVEKCYAVAFPKDGGALLGIILGPKDLESLAPSETHDQEEPKFH